MFSSSGSNGDGVLSVAAVNITGAPNVTFANSKPVTAYFSNWGPTNELLVSTVLAQGYEEMSGTSMAALYIAGVAALYLGYHGGRSLHRPGIARAVAERISTSGRSVTWGGDTTLYNQTAPPFHVGAGLVDAWKVLHYGTQLTTEPFALLDTESFKPYWTAAINNTGNSAITYKFELEPQVGMKIMDSYYGIKPLYDRTPMRIVPNVTLPEPITVRSGQTKIAEYSLLWLKLFPPWLTISP